MNVNACIIDIKSIHDSVNGLAVQFQQVGIANGTTNDATDKALNNDTDICSDYKEELRIYQESLTNKLSILADRNNLTERVYLSDAYPYHPTPMGFKGKLFPHQQTIVSAMLEIEKSRTISSVDIQLTSCAGHISEKFGSGKTIMVLATILAKPVPDNRSVIQVCRYNPNDIKRGVQDSSFVITKTFGEKNIIKPALLFVASSVVRQWEDAVKKFTNLKAFVIKNVYDLPKLNNLIKHGSINKYDLVIAKNGVVTGAFDIDGYLEEMNKKPQRKIYNIIANMTRHMAWSRLILDDYDVIKLPRPTGFINALFTWFISATEFKFGTNVNDPCEHETVEMAMMYHNLDLKALSSQYYLKSTFNVCNESKFTEDSVAVGRPVFLVHTLVNKNKRFVNMIGDMAGDDAYEIMEMLNGDAIETAAEKAGIKSSNITDIFKKILQDQYTTYTLSSTTLEFINTLNIDEILMFDAPEEGDVYYQKHVYEKREIKFNYPDIQEKILNVERACIENKKKSGCAIDRVKDNIKEGDCPVCCSPLEGDDMIIIRCCGKILCSECTIQGSQLQRYGKKLSGQCPCCRSKIAFTDLIFMNADFNLDNILEDKQEEVEIAPVAVVECVTKERSKASLLIDIINGVKDNDAVVKNVEIRGMLAGITDLKEAPADKRKVIIFSRFDESLDQMGKKLSSAGIKFKRLSGTEKQLHDTACEFHDSYDGVNVLLINGEKYSSGRNLQSATDLVFMHKIIDRNIEAQIIGRIQRLGRTYKAYIHYILYDDEIPYMRFE